MSKPVLRIGGEGSQKTTVDFSHLEKNPNYKPEEGAGDDAAAAEAAAEAQAAAEAAAQEDKTAQEIANEQAAQAQAAAQAALNDNQSQEQTFSEELMFQTLSEQLGREVKSYEDLIQKPVEVDPRVKELNEWSKRTGRPMEDYFKLQKDYSQVSDEQIAREYLRAKYPNFNEAELSYKMSTMLPDEDDLENDKIRKSMEMKMFTGEARKYFDSMKQELSQPIANLMTDEAKHKVDYYDQIKAQIDQNNQASKSYYDGLVQASSMSDKLKLSLGGDVSIDYSIAEADRKGIADYINNVPHWKNQDGSWNHEAVVKDAYKIKNFDQIMQEVYKQGLNAGQSETIRTQNNITLDSQTSAASQTDKPSTGGLKIEGGLEKALGLSRGLRIGIK